MLTGFLDQLMYAVGEMGVASLQLMAEFASEATAFAVSPLFHVLFKPIDDVLSLIRGPNISPSSKLRL